MGDISSALTRYRPANVLKHVPQVKIKPNTNPPNHTSPFFGPALLRTPQTKQKNSRTEDGSLVPLRIQQVRSLPNSNYRTEGELAWLHHRQESLAMPLSCNREQKKSSFCKAVDHLECSGSKEYMTGQSSGTFGVFGQ